MKISFADRKLEKLVSNYDKCRQKLGDRRAKLLIVRLTDLQDATTLEEIKNFPGRFHELKGDRKGQWSCDLDQPYRLIFMPHEKPIPTNADGQYIWLAITGIEVVEIVDYH